MKRSCSLREDLKFLLSIFFDNVHLNVVTSVSSLTICYNIKRKFYIFFFFTEKEGSKVGKRKGPV